MFIISVSKHNNLLDPKNDLMNRDSVYVLVIGVNFIWNH